jgi:hypothetical protein
MTTTFRTVRAGGLNVFYREAGEPGSPKLLLLGGLPPSSHQFRNLLPALEDEFHLVSLDDAGFGNTDMPDPAFWDYTFDHLAEVVDAALREIGSPGRWGSTCRITAARSATGSSQSTPDWLSWQVIQNANSYEEGFSGAWDGIRHVLWANRSPDEAPLEALLAGTVRQAHRTRRHPRREPGPAGRQSGRHCGANFREPTALCASAGGCMGDRH